MLATGRGRRRAANVGPQELPEQRRFSTGRSRDVRGELLVPPRADHERGWARFDGAMLATSSADHGVRGDLAVERDAEEAAAMAGMRARAGLPPQLMFVHQDAGPEGLRWHHRVQDVPHHGGGRVQRVQGVQRRTRWRGKREEDEEVPNCENHFQCG